MSHVVSYFKTFAGDLRRSFFDLATVIGVIGIFQFILLRTIPENLPGLLVGLAIVAIGLALFMRGLEIGIFPLGENLAQNLAASSSRFWLILFAFIIGFATTIAEPALIAVADKAALISDGNISALILRIVVALSVGFAIVLGVLRIIFGHPIHWYIIVGYMLVLGVSYFAPTEIVGLAFDLGGVTTSTVTVPLIAALGIGLATYIKGRNPVIDGFGLIAFASLTPMIFVQLYGMIAYATGSTATAITEAGHALETATIESYGVMHYVLQFFSTIGDVLPIILAILFFYFFVLRKRIEDFKKRAFGFFLVIVGLYAFVIGLEIGLFPIGETIAAELATQTGGIGLIYLFAFAIGFATTIAEPALTAIARKAEEISGKAIEATLLRVFVAVGVGTGILLGTYRIINGDSIVWYILAGYVIVVIMTYFAPRTIIPVAYDSGGVTTSTVTVPIVAALGIGLASSIPGRDPLIDGFGLIAFASLFPMIAVLGYGILQRQKIRYEEQRLLSLEKRTMTRVLNTLHDETDTTRKMLLKKKHIVTITGTPGSGVSSTARGVSEKLHYRHFSAGDLFRKIARDYNMPVEKLNELAEHNTAVDHEIDQLLIELGQSGNKLVVDSKLAYHWMHNAFKVYLQIDPHVAAERVFERSKQNESGDVTSPEDALVAIKELAESERRRYQDIYGLDISNTRPFDLVIDTAKHDLNEVVEIITKQYKQWIEAK